MSHVSDYDSSVSQAYDDLLRHIEVFVDPSSDSSYKEMRRLTGVCGQKCGAAAKRFKRAIVIDALEVERTKGRDITPSVARHFFEKLIGRGVDDRALIRIFGTPGRTAADKTNLKAEDLADIEAQLLADLKAAQVAMTAIRKRYSDAFALKVKDR